MIWQHCDNELMAKSVFFNHNNGKYNDKKIQLNTEIQKNKVHEIQEY